MKKLVSTSVTTIAYIRFNRKSRLFRALAQAIRLVRSTYTSKGAM